jgi:hypothetical protein
VEFYDGATDLGAGTALSGGGGTATATLTTTALGVGGHALRAVYTPTGVFLGSTGGAAQTVTSPRTLTVTTLADAGPGSLRAELALAQGGDTVGFAPGLAGTITLTSGGLRVGTSVTLAGPGPGVLAVSGNGQFRPLEVLPGATLSLSGLALSGGG